MFKVLVFLGLNIIISITKEFLFTVARLMKQQEERLKRV